MRAAIALLALLFLPLEAFGQTEDCTTVHFSKTCTYTVGNLNRGKVEADDLKIQFNSPTVPAGSIIGEDDLTFSTIRAASDLTPQLLNAFNENGELQTGLAIGGAPYWWFDPKETAQAYRSSPWWERVLKRTQIGIATKQEPAKEGEESNRVLVGVSIGWQLLDGQDVRSSVFADGARCLGEQIEVVLLDRSRITEAEQAIAAFDIYRTTPVPIQQAIAKKNIVVKPGDISAAWFLDEAGPGPTVLADAMAANGEFFLAVNNKAGTLTPEQKKLAPAVVPTSTFNGEAFKKAVGKCQATYDRILDEQASLSLNIASALVSDEGKIDDLEEQKTAVWLSYKSGKNFRIMKQPVLGFVSYTSNEQITLPDDTEVQGDRLIVGLGSSFKGDGNESFDFQASYIDTDYDDATADSQEYRFTASYSKKIADFVWLEAKVGTTNSDALEDASFAGISLKLDWAAMWASRQ